MRSEIAFDTFEKPSFTNDDIWRPKLWANFSAKSSAQAAARRSFAKGHSATEPACQNDLASPTVGRCLGQASPPSVQPHSADVSETRPKFIEVSNNGVISRSLLLRVGKLYKGAVHVSVRSCHLVRNEFKSRPPKKRLLNAQRIAAGAEAIDKAAQISAVRPEQTAHSQKHVQKAHMITNSRSEIDFDNSVKASLHKDNQVASQNELGSPTLGHGLEESCGHSMQHQSPHVSEVQQELIGTSDGPDAGVIPRSMLLRVGRVCNGIVHDSLRSFHAVPCIRLAKAKQEPKKAAKKAAAKAATQSAARKLAATEHVQQIEKQPLDADSESQHVDPSLDTVLVLRTQRDRASEAGEIEASPRQALCSANSHESGAFPSTASSSSSKHEADMRCRGQVWVQAEEFGELKATFNPGQLGVDICHATGLVRSVRDGSQAEHRGVFSELIIHKIQGQPYSETLLKEKMTGSEDYELTFIFPQAAAIPSKPSGSSTCNPMLGTLGASTQLETYRWLDPNTSSDREIGTSSTQLDDLPMPKWFKPAARVSPLEAWLKPPDR